MGPHDLADHAPDSQIVGVAEKAASGYARFMNDRNTTQKGNAFRDVVDRVLSSAGFSTVMEKRIGYKHVDVHGVWTRDEMAGEQRYAFEAKDFVGTLPLREASQFAADYGPLITSGAIDHAWLISKGPISPAGRQVTDTVRGLQVMTFTELQRRLLLIDSYLRDLVSMHERSRLESYFVKPVTTDGADLETQVRSWMFGDDAPPLFVLGSYGKGKSTFAGHLAAEMAREALKDPTARAPVLVRLGEIADEQSIEGLLGKVLASQHRVANYHFETFRALNKVGRFLLIYDGFDEMKHGLTAAKFQQVLTELMKLDEDDARILVLGRDTAFHDEAEFRAIIDGVQRTTAGREVPVPRRRAYRHVEIRGFTPDEARDYVSRYLPIRASEERDGPASNPAWVSQRVVELASGRFDRLLERPVHAQMLCEIAIQPDQLRTDMSVYELFDSFVHYLLLRELDKRGRDPDFPIDVRRKFNASLAWWLWERGGTSTTTLADIPQSLCDAAAKEVRHSLGRDEMRRELIQGCLVEKGPATIYFHRSLQEFLAAEHLIETDLLQKSNPKNHLMEVTSAITPEIIEFIVAGAGVSVARRDKALGWFDALSDANGERVPLPGFELFVQLAVSVDAVIGEPWRSPWLTWLSFFVRTGARDFSHRGRNTFPVLADMLNDARGRSREAVIYALSRTLSHPVTSIDPHTATALAAMIPVRRLREAVESARVKKSERQIVRHAEDYMLWALLRAWRIETVGDVLMVSVDIARLHHDALMQLSNGFDDDLTEGAVPVTQLMMPVQAIYRALGAQKPSVGERDIEGIRPFFNDGEIRRSISPIQIETRRVIHRIVDPVIRINRATLSPRKPGEPTNQDSD
jgi:hypothetical protein